MKKKVLIVFAIVLVIAFVVVYIQWARDPFRKTLEELREEMLAHTPIGSSIDEVAQYIQSNNKLKWDGNVFPCGDMYMGGEQSIRASLPCFYLVFKKTIVIDWAFDAENKLIDVRVDKEIAGF